MSKILEKNEEVKSPMFGKQVYFVDFYNLLLEAADEASKDLEGYQFCCNCAGTENEDDCECVKRKERRDQTEEWFMTAGLLSLDEACEKVMAMAIKIVETLREKSFICECPPVKSKIEEEKSGDYQKLT